MVGIIPAIAPGRRRPGCKARLERQQQDHIGEKRVELEHGASSYEEIRRRLAVFIKRVYFPLRII